MEDSWTVLPPEKYDPCVVLPSAQLYCLYTDTAFLKVQVKFFLCLTKHHAMKTYRGRLLSYQSKMWITSYICTSKKISDCHEINFMEQLVKKFSTLHGTQKFITVFT
jgi:hypothetical protein